MPFSYRNARYLRISEHTVVPLYVYLDERHINWMKDHILQCVLEDLRPKIGPKLRAETGYNRGDVVTKKGSVDVHRGETYQFAYWFRKNEPHAVLIKNRQFVPVSSEPTRPPAKDKESSKGKESDTGVLETLGKPRRSSRKRKATNYYDGSGDENEADDAADEGGSDSALADFGVTAASPSDFPLQGDIDEEEEEKPKMQMQLTYKGFAIYDRCLCVIIQPWPLDSSSVPRISTVDVSRNPSVAPTSELQERTNVRERTPLFLPEWSPRRSITPALWRSHDEAENDEDNGDNDEGDDMLAFTQAMTSFREERAGSADEDDGTGDAFLADADERRGL